jgi:hemerythrin-like domain-containing protein
VRRVSNRRDPQSARAFENNVSPAAAYRPARASRSDRVNGHSVRASQEFRDVDNSRGVPMIDTISQLRAEHVNFGKLLDLLDEQLDLFHKDDLPNYELMLDIMFYMTHYPDLFHHPKEDLAFGKIEERNARVRPAIEELMKQHVLMKESGERLVADLDGIVNGSIVPRERIEEPGRTYVANFRNHMEKEETDLFPVAAKLLGPNDWSAIDATIAPLEDPIFGKSAEKRYAAIREQMARETGFEKHHHPAP